MAAKATTYMTRLFTLYSLLLSLKINVHLLNYLNATTVTTEEAIFSERKSFVQVEKTISQE
jgi:hypothetical protein